MSYDVCYEHKQSMEDDDSGCSRLTAEPAGVSVRNYTLCE